MQPVWWFSLLQAQGNVCSRFGGDWVAFLREKGRIFFSNLPTQYVGILSYGSDVGGIQGFLDRDMWHQKIRWKISINSFQYNALSDAKMGREEMHRKSIEKVQVPSCPHCYPVSHSGPKPHLWNWNTLPSTETIVFLAIFFHGEVGEVVNFGRLLGGVLCTWGVTMIGSPCRRHFKHTLAWGITLAQFDATPWMPRLEGDAYRSSFRSGRNAPRRHTPSGFAQRNVVSKLQTTICWGFSYEYSGGSCCYLGDWMTFTASSRMNDDQWVVVCGGPSAVVHLDVIRWSRFDSIEWCQPNLLLNTPNLAYHTLT